MSIWTLSRKWRSGVFDFPSFALGVVAKALRVEGFSPVLMRVVLSEADVICLELPNRQHPNIWWSLRGLKAHLVSDG